MRSRVDLQEAVNRDELRNKARRRPFSRRDGRIGHPFSGVIQKRQSVHPTGTGCN